MNKHSFSQKSLIAAAFAMLCAIRAIAGTVTITDNITANATWTSDNQYILVGLIYVKNNAILTIDPGTIIKGDSESLGSLIVARGSKLIAIGTPSQPIIFTSAKPAGSRNRGDWGGLIILGYAPVNWPGDTGHVEGISPNPDTRYGGGLNPNCGSGDCPDVHDNSGTLQYVRVEFGGIALAPNNEINGLTLGGVGDGTTIDHVQVSYSNDDSFEWFGGTVNVRYLIAYDGIDDDFDTDNGFSGRGQFLLGMRDPNIADVSGSKTFESDNDPTGSINLPQTNAVFGNVTGLGGENNTSNILFKQSAHLRRNTNEKIYNSILMGFPQGILVDGSSTIANCASGSLVKNCYVQQDTAGYFFFTPSTDAGIPLATTQLTSNGNVYSTQYTGILGNPDFPVTNISSLLPAAGNPLPAADNTVYNGDAFFNSVTYVGAFNPAGDTWADSWTNFNPQNESYTGIASPLIISKTNVYPNPMKTSSTIEFSLAESNLVNIAITDVAGRTIREVMHEFLNAGSHIVTVNLRDLSTGMYFLLIRSGNDNQMIKLSVED